MYNIMTKYGATFTSPVFFTSFHFFHFLHFPGLHSSFIFFGPSFSVFVFIKPTCSVVGNAASLRQWKEQYSQFVDKELSEFRVFFSDTGLWRLLLPWTNRRSQCSMPHTVSRSPLWRLRMTAFDPDRVTVVESLPLRHGVNSVADYDWINE